MILTDIPDKYELLSYASPPIWKLHPHGEVTSKTYKPAFHGGDTPIQLSLP